MSNPSAAAREIPNTTVDPPYFTEVNLCTLKLPSIFDYITHAYAILLHHRPRILRFLQRHIDNHARNPVQKPIALRKSHRLQVHAHDPTHRFALQHQEPAKDGVPRSEDR